MSTTNKIKLKKNNPVFTTTKINDKKYTKLLHISDIHIRPDERLDEYELVFSRLYNFLDQQKDNDTSLLVITGDIYYSKNVFKPSSNYVLTKFFKETSKRIDVVLITGNHDMNEQNLEQIDALTPLLTFSPVYYLRDTGLYQFGNVVFSVSSLTDAKFIKHSMIDTTKYPPDTKFIKLYHGMLKGAIGDNGLELKVSTNKKTSRCRTTSDFKGYNAVLLGDIHKYQFLNKKQTIAYCGSLIQQNHGETLDHHGVLIWNIANKKITTQYAEIENDYGFVTFELVNNKLINPKDKYPKYIYARFFLTKTSDFAMNDIEKELLKKGHTIIDKNVKYKDTVLLDDIKVDKDEKTFNDEDVFKSVLKDKKFSNEDINAMLKYHTTVKSKIEQSSDHLSSVWKPDSIEFRNFFLYGGDYTNSIEFRKGVMSIVAPNNNGKTSVLKTVLFALFGEIYNDFGSAIKYINNMDNKKYAYTDTKLSVGKTVLNIRREHENFVKSKKGVTNAKFKHSFKYDDSDKTGIHKIDTNKKITHYIGSKDMFVTLNVCSTKINKNFANFNKKDMNKFLQQIFKLDVFEKYEKLAMGDKRIYNDKLKTLEGSLAILQEQVVKNEDLDKQLKDMANCIIEQQKKQKSIDKDILKSKKYKDELHKKHSALCKLIDSDCFKHNFDDTKNEYDKLKNEFSNKQPVNSGVLNRKLEKLFKKLVPVNEDAQDDYDECTNNLDELGWKEGDKIDYNADKYNELKIDKLTIQKNISKLKSDSKKHNSKKLKKQKDKLLKKIGIDNYNDNTHDTDVNKISKLIRNLHKQKLPNAECSQKQLDELIEKRNLIDKCYHTEFTDEDNDKLLQLKNKYSILKNQLGDNTDDDDNVVITDDNDKITKAIQRYPDEICSETVVIEHGGKITITFGKSFGNSNKGTTYHRKVNVQRIRDVLSWVDNSRLHSEFKSVSNKIEQLENCKNFNQLSNDIADMSKNIDIQLKNQKIDDEINTLENKMQNIEFINEIKDIDKLINEASEIDKLISDEKIKLNDVSKLLETAENMKMISENIQNRNNLVKEIEKIKLNSNIQKEIDDAKNEIKYNEQINHFIELEKLYNKFINASEQLDEINKIDNNIDTYVNKINKLQQESQMLSSNCGTLTANIDELKDKKDKNIEKLKKINDINSELIIVKKMITMLTTYKEMVKYDGVPNALIKKKKEDICKFVNDFIKGFTNLKVDIIDDTVCVEKDKKWFHVGNVGGFESWLISVAFKTALNRFSYYSKSAIMLIDEEVDCIDVANFDKKLPAILDKLKHFYYSILLVSHRDISKLKDWDVIIKNNGTYSIIDSVQ